MEIQICKAGLNEISEIAQIARKAWYIAYPEIITVAQIEFMLKKFYDAAVLSEIIHNENHLFLLIRLNEERANIGFLHFSKTNENSWHLQKFYILPEFQKKKIGQKSFNLALNYIKSNISPEVLEIRLNVNRINFKAINFYFKTGFFIESVKDIDIGDGFFMNDFIMLYSVKQ